jgi:phage/plasmid-like protein (TIGR03299 family)
MSANVETMFYVREMPWHGLGVRVEEALSSRKALELSGLDWSVIQKSIFTSDNDLIPSFKANIRESDGKVLGVVTDRYKIVQNNEAFAFTDSLVGEGVSYETAGSLGEGRKVWVLAKLPEKYKLLDDEVTPYLVFSNSHDGTNALKIAMTPI